MSDGYGSCCYEYDKRLYSVSRDAASFVAKLAYILRLVRRRRARLDDSVIKRMILIYVCSLSAGIHFERTPDATLNMFDV